MIMRLVWTIGPLCLFRKVETFAPFQVYSIWTNKNHDTKYWGERPAGKWFLRVAMKGLNREMAKMTKYKLGPGRCLSYCTLLIILRFLMSCVSYSWNDRSVALSGESLGESVATLARGMTFFDSLRSSICSRHWPSLLRSEHALHLMRSHSFLFCFTLLGTFRFSSHYQHD